MSVVLLANVGLRDVRLGGAVLSSPRCAGEKLLAEFETRKEQVSLPMLSVVVEQLLREHARIRVVLYGTDQPESTEPVYRDNDTIHTARVAARLLEWKYGRAESKRGTIEKVDVRTIPTDPSPYDDMISFFNHELQEARQENRWGSPVEMCYVFPVGGTPACNMGLMLAAVETFGDACRTLYLREGDTRVTRMDVGEQIRRRAARKLAADRLRDHSFGAAIPLLQEAAAPEWVVQVARYATARYHFDFEAATEALEKAVTAACDDWKLRLRLSKLRRPLEDLRAREHGALFRELYHNAALAHRRGEYASFLGIVFRVQEEALATMVREIYPWLEGIGEGRRGEARFRDSLGTHGELLAWLADQRVEGQPLRPDSPNTEVMAALVRSSWEGPEPLESAEKRERIMEAYRLVCERLNSLKKLRNKCIVAHGFEGVSERAIKKEYGEGDPVQDVAAGIRCLGVGIEEDPFEEAARLALRGLGMP